jgi:hypothetical protein
LIFFVVQKTLKSKLKSLKTITLALAVKILNNPSALTLPFFVFVAWATWAVRSHFFFWDTVQLGSQHAQFFFDNSFSTLLLPNEMDSGHPPTFGFYLAIVWKLMDKSLGTSHLAMLPFLFGIVWQSWRVGEKILGEGWAYLFLLLLLVNPVVASQCVLVSPDLVLCFFFLLALNGIFREKKILLALALLGLAAVSMRGMMVVGALFLFQMLMLRFRKFLKFPKSTSNTEGENIEKVKSNKVILNHPITIVKQLVTPYLLGGLFAFIFFIYHFVNKGWIGYHAGSSWAEAFQTVDFKGFIKNIILLIWRFIDFGHLFIGFTILFLTIKKVRNTRHLFPTTRQLWLLLIVLIVVLTPTLIMYQGLLNHRYLLPIYITACLLCVKLISDMKNWRQQLKVSAVVFVGLASGNFWVYPQPIATGWDSTLAHLPFYRLRNDMLQFIDNQKINYTDIGTAFPNLRSFSLVDLKDTPSVSAIKNDFGRLDLNKNQYVFYSNVMNELTGEQLVTLQTHWQVVHALRSGQVEVILYKK